MLVVFVPIRNSFDATTEMEWNDSRHKVKIKLFEYYQEAANFWVNIWNCFRLHTIFWVCVCMCVHCNSAHEESTWTSLYHILDNNNNKTDSVLPRNFHVVFFLPVPCFSILRMTVFCLTLWHTQRYAKGMQCMTYESFLLSCLSVPRRRFLILILLLSTK